MYSSPPQLRYPLLYATPFYATELHYFELIFAFFSKIYTQEPGSVLGNFEFDPYVLVYVLRFPSTRDKKTHLIFGFLQ